MEETVAQLSLEGWVARERELCQGRGGLRGGMILPEQMIYDTGAGG